ncbi:hypothetical protein Angca_006095, partial [Angiostrongylus cantonensis]
AFKSIEDVVKKKNTRLHSHLFDSTVLPALTYASENWSLLERTVLRVSCFTHVRDEIRRSDLRQRSKNNDTVLHTKQSRIGWAGHVIRMSDKRWTTAVSDLIPRDAKRTLGRPPTRWSEFSTKSLEERY